jgi:hypothetical protein
MSRNVSVVTSTSADHKSRRSVAASSYIGAAVDQPHTDRWQDAGEVVDNGQHTDFSTVEQLIRQEVHRPAVVDGG